MKYNKFILKGYRGLSDTEISIAKESLVPIIGKNESGKTTCLEAINAFDFSNDDDNQGKHLLNVENLYSTVPLPVIVAAEIIMSERFNIHDFFAEKLKIIESHFQEIYPNGKFNIYDIDFTKDKYNGEDFAKAFLQLEKEISAKGIIIIERDLGSKMYSIPIFRDSLPSDFVDSLCKEMIKSLPYILYFDDFRDRIEERVYITDDEDSGVYSNWIKYIDELFRKTRSEYSVFTLNSKSDSQRRSIIAEVEKYLNKVLTEEWAKYQFERNESIQIKIEYVQNSEEPYLIFKILEKVIIEGNLEDRYFDIADRSKGFYWYFNFMIKLHFNPSKREDTDIDTIYLLDEPGSYLHTYALGKLAEQLQRLSANNKVIYCTHFHDLLNPEYIPINSIRIAEKIDRGCITLKRIDYASNMARQKNSAYQPILDALEVKPPLMDFGINDIVLVEGIYDFYSFKMFTSDKLSYFPCVSASSIVNQIPYMIFLGKRYLALWDNDAEGRARLEKAQANFGEVESSKFLVLDAISHNENTRLEEYYNRQELEVYSSTVLELPNVNFNKIVLSLFYSKERESQIHSYFPKSKSNFEKMEGVLIEKLGKQEMK